MKGGRIGEQDEEGAEPYKLKVRSKIGTWCGNLGNSRVLNLNILPFA
jgi:hypothetical protein